MARGSLISAGGLPEVTFLARSLGDYSSIKGGITQAIDFGKINMHGKNINPLAERMRNRIAGRAGGLVLGKANAWMGLWGMVAVAQGIAVVQSLIQIHAAKETWVGSMVNYAQAVDKGHAGPVPVAATNFFSDAVKTATQNRFGSSFGSGFMAIPKMGSRGNVVSRARGGLYSGQKFIGDFGSLLRGDIGSRIIRKEAGRQVASFFWGTLSDPKQNVLKSFGYDIAKEARRNISKQQLIDTGALYASIAVSDLGRVVFIEKSIRQTAARLLQVGQSQMLQGKIDSSPVGGPF